MFIVTDYAALSLVKFMLLVRLINVNWYRDFARKPRYSLSKHKYPFHYVPCHISWALLNLNPMLVNNIRNVEGGILLFRLIYIIWASTRENLSSGFANNKGADQPAHPRRLISTLVIRVW